VLESVLQMAGRQDLIVARKLTGAREKLREMLAMIDQLQSGLGHLLAHGLPYLRN
jgi:hypothetical protein